MGKKHRIERCFFRIWEESGERKMEDFMCCVPLLLAVCHSSEGSGDGNVDGGGEAWGRGSDQNVWSPGNDGVRVTVVRAEGREPVTRPVDLTNKNRK